jgi:hypothetical protein
VSAPEHEGQVEQRSSIKVVRNAKGDAQFEAKVVQGATDAELEQLRRQAVAQYRELARELGT